MLLRSSDDVPEVVDELMVVVELEEDDEESAAAPTAEGARTLPCDGACNGSSVCVCGALQLLRLLVLEA